MEKWDILNADGALTGKTTLRGRCNLKPGEYHLVVHIWVVSSRGEFLIQRRSDNKKLMPGEWAATGGAAISGEDSYTAANRELYEELGIPSSRQTLKKIARIKRRNSLLDIWFINTDIESDKLMLQKDETLKAQYEAEIATLKGEKREKVEEIKNEIKDQAQQRRDEFEGMIDGGKFHNYGKEYFDTVFQKIDDLLGVRA